MTHHDTTDWALATQPHYDRDYETEVQIKGCLINIRATYHYEVGGGFSDEPAWSEIDLGPMFLAGTVRRLSSRVRNEIVRLYAKQLHDSIDDYEAANA